MYGAAVALAPGASSASCGAPGACVVVTAGAVGFGLTGTGDHGGGGGGVLTDAGGDPGGGGGGGSSS